MNYFNLQVLQNDLQEYLFIYIPRLSPGPQLRFQPLGMFFLFSFAFVLITQFIGMFAHRWGTLLHTLAITDIGFGNNDAQQRMVSSVKFNGASLISVTTNLYRFNCETPT